MHASRQTPEIVNFKEPRYVNETTIVNVDGYSLNGDKQRRIASNAMSNTLH